MFIIYLPIFRENTQKRVFSVHVGKKSSKKNLRKGEHAE